MRSEILRPAQHVPKLYTCHTHHGEVEVVKEVDNEATLEELRQMKDLKRPLGVLMRCW